jgi:hypothetical protein
MKNLLLVATILSVSLASAAEPELVELSPKFVEGQEFRFEVTQSQKIQTGQQASSGKFWTEFELKVKQAGADGARVEIRYVNCAVEINRGDTAMKFDSRAKEEGFQEMAPAVMDIVGRKVTAVLDASGRILNVEGLEELKKGVGAQSFGGVLDEEIFKRGFSKVFAPVPGKNSLAVGASQRADETADMNRSVNLVVAMDYKLDSADDKDAIINITGNAEFKPNPPIERLPEGARIGDQSIKGTIVWDRANRVIRRYDLRTSLVFLRKTPDGQTREMTTETRTSTVRTSP